MHWLKSQFCKRGEVFLEVVDLYSMMQLLSSHICCKLRAHQGIEPGIVHTQNRNHTPKTSHISPCVSYWILTSCILHVYSGEEHTYEESSAVDHYDNLAAPQPGEISNTVSVNCTRGHSLTVWSPRGSRPGLLTVTMHHKVQTKLNVLIFP